MPQAAKQLVADLLRAWNEHDVEGVAAFYAPEYQGVDVGEVMPQRGPEGVRQTMTHYLNAFPDLRLRAESIVVQGRRVALAWTARGTHRGRLMNIPPTGRKVTVRGISLLTMKDGKLTRGLHVWDVAGLLRAIGLLPELATFP